MAIRIKPHPNPPYLKSDGTLNASGQIKIYEAGTSTPATVYKDASGTSYGSTVDLDSAGLPDEGPIYWDNSALYKVEVYYDDGAGGYTLDYTVDNFGEVPTDALTTITEDTAWTVDGVGGTSTSFASLTAAMDEARNRTIVDGNLTITIQDGTYTNDSADLSHPQGQNIYIVGQSQSGTILKKTSGFTGYLIDYGDVLGGISNLTIQTTLQAGRALTVYGRLNLLDCTCENLYAGNATSAAVLVDGGFVGGSGFIEVDSFDKGVHVTTGGNFSCVALDVSNCASGGYGIYVDTNSTCSISDFDVSEQDVAITADVYCRNGGAVHLDSCNTTHTNNTNNGLYAEYGGTILVALTLDITKADIGCYAVSGGTIYIKDTTPSFTTVTTNYTAGAVTTANTIASTTATSADLAIIYQD